MDSSRARIQPASLIDEDPEAVDALPPPDVDARASSNYPQQRLSARSEGGGGVYPNLAPDTMAPLSPTAPFDDPVAWKAQPKLPENEPQGGHTSSARWAPPTVMSIMHGRPFSTVQSPLYSGAAFPPNENADSRPRWGMSPTVMPFSPPPAPGTVVVVNSTPPEPPPGPECLPDPNTPMRGVCGCAIIFWFIAIVVIARELGSVTLRGSRGLPHYSAPCQHSAVGKLVGFIVTATVGSLFCFAACGITSVVAAQHGCRRGIAVALEGLCFAALCVCVILYSIG